jgi:hypothetical protein
MGEPIDLDASPDFFGTIQDATDEQDSPVELRPIKTRRLQATDNQVEDRPPSRECSRPGPSTLLEMLMWLLDTSFLWFCSLCRNVFCVFVFLWLPRRASKHIVFCCRLAIKPGEGRRPSCRPWMILAEAC